MSSAFTSEEEELVRSAEAQVARLTAASAAADQAETGRIWDALIADGGGESRCAWCTI